MERNEETCRKFAFDIDISRAWAYLGSTMSEPYNMDNTQTRTPIVSNLPYGTVSHRRCEGFPFSERGKDRGIVHISVVVKSVMKKIGVVK